MTVTETSRVEAGCYKNGYTVNTLECSKCGHCDTNYRTTLTAGHDWSSRTRTITSATYDHGGEKETTKTCRRCGKTEVSVSYLTPISMFFALVTVVRDLLLVGCQTHYTSRLDDDDSSSGGSSSGGGYSGGSSSGGGASSSWAVPNNSRFEIISDGEEAEKGGQPKK